MWGKAAWLLRLTPWACSVRPAPYTLHPTPYTLQGVGTLYRVLAPTLGAPQTPKFELEPLNPNPESRNPKPGARNPNPESRNPNPESRIRNLETRIPTPWALSRYTLRSQGSRLGSKCETSRNVKHSLPHKFVPGNIKDQSEIQIGLQSSFKICTRMDVSPANGVSAFFTINNYF